MTAEMTGAAGLGRGGRMSRQRKRDAVLRLLRGEDLERRRPSKESIHRTTLPDGGSLRSGTASSSKQDDGKA